jgi:hypothetical protein
MSTTTPRSKQMLRTTTKAATKSSKPTLRAAQVRILAALAKADAPLTRREIAEAAPCDTAGLTEWIGSSDPEKRKANDEKWFPSLLSRKLISAKDTDAVTVYSVTARGRKVAEKAAAK